MLASDIFYTSSWEVYRFKEQQTRILFIFCILMYNFNFCVIFVVVCFECLALAFQARF